jgi:predicted amidophosphoribosyltransferase
MQPIEIALFGAVVALAAGLIGYIFWLRTRARSAARATLGTQRAVGSRSRAGADAGPSLVCPACQREYDPGLQFCPHDARELVPATDPAARTTAPGMACPNCRRSFDAMKRFCPFDGDELVPLTLALGTASVQPSLGATAAGVASVATVAGLANAASVAMMGKICPHCSRRYENDATFCGRDGAALVSVN